ncbi:MAG TPA: selenium cofactor biosynthesis protein YqeC [Steroidobacteraceae bacterium]|nr:selenium cofactor biosynthesis protein YqeC [Steroidobacteraceae bacterium]
MSNRESLLDLLDARAGIVCAVGAGGKKSLLQHLAKSHPGRVAISCTVVTPHFPATLGFGVAIEPAERLPAAVAALDRAAGVAYACPSDKDDRHTGVPPALIEHIHREQAFAATYVKADGARMRWIKAPDDDEQVVPDSCSLVLAIVSARALGEPLGPRVAHRMNRLQAVTGLAMNEPILPLHVGRLIASPAGLQKGSESHRVLPVINMVDDARREALAREAAAIALDLNPRIEQVVLTCLQRTDDPVVAVVRR